ncbi:hypothetical protein D9V32_05470 [Mycetocola tolaasinivorans]|uniref:Acb2/Tad1 hairpin domain-containing protein n=1 Tax=Mycetocola tolaasinivorans TaxID=76635 RepID=A0A3L7A7M0_9MICO|nr:hypothetical protein [Mycetocola tolaasinivorans]RLP76319.1 hypothetical protein D9V32_05470 [Mycetocola tolaasinivorans]
MVSLNEVDARFISSSTKPAPSLESISLSKDLTERFHSLAEFIAVCVPDGRNQSLALTDLESALMWANKAAFNDAPASGGE